DDLTGAYQPYRYFKGYVIKGGKIYGLTTFKSLIESNDLIEQITLTFTIMTLLLVVGVFFLMRILGQRLWSSFFVALEQVKNFDVTRRERIIFRDTDIYEFNVLNESLEKLIKRIQQDFINLKEFTENITHEIQTPLAVIRSKTELLLQNPDLTSEQAQLLSSISNSLRRLTKLNHGLVLLTKIENNQFHKTEPVIINHIINQVLENYEDFMEAKNLRLEKLFNEELIIKMNPVLADVLVQNLLKNAVVHNINNGWIRIIIDKEALQLSNTGLKSKKNSNLLFKRFAHGEFRPESMGIGLSLVKKICDYYGIAIEYSIKEEVHTLTLMPEAFER
ncbi:MAG: sensor histidine kinase, partial [Bacteroidota bacterium]